MFTVTEKAFIARHHIDERDVYDGRGESKYRKETKARDAGKDFILTSSPCRAAGHLLRTRAGHCIQCDPKKIAYMRRETVTGYVYIAGTLEGRLIKIGQTDDIERRAKRLKAESYGGFSDWRVLICVQVKNAGKTEREISSRISGKRVAGGYFKDGEAQTAIEMIQCSFSSALSVFADETLAMVDREELVKIFRDYEFA